MPQRDEISPERLDALVDGTDSESLAPDDQPFATLMSELRASEEAPADLRRRVRDMVQPRETARARLARRLRATSWTQRAIAFAPACVLVVGTVFAVSAISQDNEIQVAERLTQTTPSSATAAPQEEAKQAPLAQATLTVRVENSDAITAAGAKAREIAASLGGSTVEERYSRTSGEPDTAVVTLTVPPERYADTRAALSRIGSISDEVTAFGGADVAAPPAAVAERSSAAPAGTTITVTFTTR
jgi:Domain of unknown function (DUF4349)